MRYRHYEGKIITPYGGIMPELIDRFKKLAGYIWNEDDQEWTILQDEIVYYHLNTSDDKKSNEGKWYKKKGWLTARDYNFEYAYYVCDGDIEKAMDYVEDKLTELDGKPVYLPEVLGGEVELKPGQKFPSYTKILKEEREAFEKRNR